MDPFAILEELGWGLCLGEHVRYIFFSRYVLENNDLVCNLMADKVVLNIDMFGTLVFGLLLSHGDTGGVILMDNSRSPTGVPEGKRHLLDPDGVTRT